MTDRIFVDTNILIYAHDADAGQKHFDASMVIRRLWEEEIGVLSTQVLQEFYVNVTRKIPRPISKAKARGLIQNYFPWVVESIGPRTILLASEIEDRYRLSFWDALIIAAAQESGAEKVLSEDFKSGQTIEGIIVINPFLHE